MTPAPRGPRAALLAALLVLAGGAVLSAQRRERPRESGPMAALSLILGRPTDRSIALSVRSATAQEARIEWRSASGATGQAGPFQLPAQGPAEVELTGLQPDTAYTYRLALRLPGGTFEPGPEGAFHTARAPGRAFTFALQGDSHPERPGKMFDPALYARTLRQAAQGHPDFYLTLGDDFSIERLLEQQAATQAKVDEVYAHQRGFLGLVGQHAPVFLVNGNHEQASRYLLDGTEGSPAVLAARARIRHYPLPAPDRFYSGDAERVEPIGLLRDYYAWTWGDALFVVLDPYWHSAVAVDNRAGERPPPGGPGEPRPGGRGRRDLWEPTLGEAQYRWLSSTLLESRARWKFVFAHHVNGTGRGGVEASTLFEWGGADRRGVNQFAERRPGWPLPIHDLMVKAGVSIFFQGHDHLYARQERDGVVYQTVPNPADPTYTAFNRDAYLSGEVLPNSGHLRVVVSPEVVRVDYVRAFLPADQTPEQVDGAIARSYTLKPRPERKP